MGNKFVRIFIIFFIATLTGIDHGAAGEFTDVAKEVTKGIEKGSAREIARHFGAAIDLKLPGNEGTYSRNQAELILRNFFSRNPVKSFEVQHQGPSRDGSVYVIGTYTSKNGKSYRVYYLMKTISGTMVLHLLQMDEN